MMDTKDYLAVHGHIPSEIWVGAESVAPADYLSTLSAHFPVIIRGNVPATIEIKRAKTLLENHIDVGAAQRIWKWQSSQGKFKAPAMLELAKLQTWTLKPAVLS